MNAFSINGDFCVYVKVCVDYLNQKRKERNDSMEKFRYNLRIRIPLPYVVSVYHCLFKKIERIGMFHEKVDLG